MAKWKLREGERDSAIEKARTETEEAMKNLQMHEQVKILFIVNFLHSYPCKIFLHIESQIKPRNCTVIYVHA